MILSVDPGKHVGWALWYSHGDLLDAGVHDIDDFCELLRVNHFQSPQVVVYEDFRLQRHRAERQTGSRFEASQVIGMLKLHARMLGAAEVRQELEARDLGYMHSGMAKATDHDRSHDLDAVAHGYYYLETVGITPRLHVPSL